MVKTVFGAVLSWVIVLKCVQNTWIQLLQSTKEKWKEPVQNQKRGAEPDIPVKKKEQVSKFGSPECDVFVQQYMICCVGNSCISGNNRKADHKTG